MSELVFWKSQEAAEKIEKRIQEEMQRISFSLTNGSLLLNKDTYSLTKEYSYNLGYMEGLKFLFNLIKYSGDSDE